MIKPKSYHFEIWKDRKENDLRYSMFVREANTKLTWSINGSPGFFGRSTTIEMFCSNIWLTNVTTNPDLTKYTKMMDEYFESQKD